MHFLAHCWRTVREYPLRIYEDALAAAPRKGLISKYYESHLRAMPLSSLLRNPPKDHWDPPPQVFKDDDNDEGIQRILISPDGKELATFIHMSPRSSSGALLQRHCFTLLIQQLTTFNTCQRGNSNYR